MRWLIRCRRKAPASCLPRPNGVDHPSTCRDFTKNSKPRLQWRGHPPLPSLNRCGYNRPSPPINNSRGLKGDDGINPSQLPFNFQESTDGIPVSEEWALR
jgi:hypothetical protein